MNVLDRWDKLYNRRLDWAYNGKDKFVEALINEDASNLVNMQNSDEKIISVFGKPQVGKTTLILKLIGIDHNSISELSSVLKGSRKTGESSTATAVIYSVSDNQNFIIKKDGLEIEYEIASEVSKFIDGIRLEIERTPSLINNYLEIKFPRRYFVTHKSTEFSQVKIVDLPGYGSTSHNEHSHVNFIIDKFISKSSLILIVESSNNLINVNTLKFINNKYFELNNSQHRVVLTHSVSARSIKKSIKELSSINKSEYLTIFNREIEVNINSSSTMSIKFYPLEYGKSWDQLKENDIEILNMVSPIIDELFEELRSDIINSTNKYNQLIKYTGMAKNLEEIKLLRLFTSNEYLAKNKKIKSTMERRLKKYTTLKSKLLVDINESKQQIIKHPSSNFKFIQNDFPISMKKSKLIKYLEDEKKRFNEYMVEYLDNYLSEIESSYFKLVSYGMKFDFDNKTYNLINKLKNKMFDMYLIFEMKKWEEDVLECKMAISNFIESSKSTFFSNLDYMINDHNSVFFQNISDKEKKILKIDKLIMKIKISITAIETLIESEKNEITKINRTFDSDIANFKRFFKFIEDSYFEEIMNTFNSINNKKTDATEKCIMCAYLKLIVEEFEKLEACR